MTGFAPRRLCHVNLWVSDLEETIAFFEGACGIQLVRRERDLLAGFHSNGNTHHDIGLLETTKGVDRIGRDGAVQLPKTRGLHAGLNHLGWEMEDEAQLVEVYRRLTTEQPPRLADHLISHSVYLADPDGNMHEFYADAIPDWRTVFNLEHEDLVTAVWDPDALPPTAQKFYPVEPNISYVAGASLKPIRLTGANITTARYDAMADFFMKIGGLTMTETTEGTFRRAILSGDCGQPDLMLTEVGPGESVGLRGFSFILDPTTDLDQAIAGLRTKNIGNPVLIDHGDRRSLVLDDPEGLFKIEFYIPRSGRALPTLAA